MKRSALYIIIGAFALAIAGCGGGGGGGGAVNNTVSGVASKGIIKNGVVQVYAVNADGTEGALLQTTSTDPAGHYQASVGNYTGAVLVKVTGSYTDEATGQPVTIPADKPLRAALDKVAGNVSVAVTPLTELAVQKAGTLTSDNVKSANAAVSTQFGVDVIGVQPVAPEAVSSAGTTQAQKSYTLALATISEMAAPTGGGSASIDAVKTVIGTMKADLADNTMSQATKDSFTTALNTYLNDTTHNTTGVTTDTVPAALLNVGTKTSVVKLSVAGITGKVYGVDLTLDLPAGVTVVAGSDGTVSNAVLAGAAGGLTTAKYTAASGSTAGKVRLATISSDGIAAGEFVSITVAVADGVTPSFSNALVESGVQIVDINGRQLSGASVTVTAN